MNLPSINYRHGMGIQAVVNLMVALWSKHLSQRFDSVNVPGDLVTVVAEPGAARYCESLKANFVYDTNTPIALADGISIVGSVHGGVWVRQPTGERAWAEQELFYVNWDSGSDLNPGTLAMPLQTLAEWARRVPEVRCAMTLIIQDAPPAGQDPMPNNIKIGSGASLEILGGRIRLADKSGTITAWTAPDPLDSAQPLGRIADAAVDFTGLEGNLIEIVEQNAWAHIVRGANGTADISRPLVHGPGYVISEATPVNGNTFHVYTVPRVAVKTAGLITSRAALNIDAPPESFAMTDISLDYAGAETGFDLTTSGMPLISRCSFPANTNIFGDLATYTVYFRGQVDMHNSGGGFHSGLAGGLGALNIWGDCSILTGGIAWAGETVYLKNGFVKCAGPIAVEDAVNGVVVDTGATLHFDSSDASLSGKANSGYGLKILPGGKVTGLSTADLTPLSIQGSDIDHGLIVGDTVMLLVDPITNAAVPVPSPCVQWVAQFYDPGVFAGVAFNSNNGAYIGP